MKRLLILLFTVIAACGTAPTNVDKPVEQQSAAANWPISEHTVLNTGVDYGHFVEIPGNTQVCWPSLAMFHNGHYGVATWPNGHPKQGASISTTVAGNSPSTTFLDTRLGFTFDYADAYALGIARCAPWSNFEDAWNPGWVLRDTLNVYAPVDGNGVVTKSKWLWQADAFCYLSGWGSISHAGESARVERVPVNGAINGHQWRLRLTGSGWSAAGAQCIYLGRDYEFLPIITASINSPNRWMQIGPGEGMCVISAVTGNTDNGTVAMGVDNDQNGIPLWKLSISGAITSAQGYCVRWWSPYGLQKPLQNAED